MLFSIPPITEVKVIDCTQSISSHKASGIDKLSPRWKAAKFFPLFKGGDSEDLNNYWPISVLPFLSKVIERHVHDSLSSYFCENNLIYSKQSGFGKLHSRETALIKIIDDLLVNLDNDRVSGMILINYCKAFDMVDHFVLQDKLYAYGLDNT